jgi:hypothetical protein
MIVSDGAATAANRTSSRMVLSGPEPHSLDVDQSRRSLAGRSAVLVQEVELNPLAADDRSCRAAEDDGCVDVAVVSEPSLSGSDAKSSPKRREVPPRSARALHSLAATQAHDKYVGLGIRLKEPKTVRAVMEPCEGQSRAVLRPEYARNGIWTAVHLGQFTSLAILLAGLLVLFSALDIQAGTTRGTCRFGAVSAAATLALFGVIQAVDGLALKQAVNAWASAPEAEKAARFASAEAIRWLEWGGVRSSQNFTLGVALLLRGAAMAQSAWLPRPMVYLAGLSGLTYLAQGWVGSTQGFSPAQSMAIVLAWVLSLVWMIWLAGVAWQRQETVMSRGT